MEPFLLYLLKSGSCLAVFYICFKLLLSGDTFFRFNRWILLVGTALCLALPFCRIPMAQPSPLSAPVNRLETLWLDEPAESGLPASEADPVETQGWDWSVVVGGIYFAGCYVSLLLTLLSFYRMKRLAKEGRRIRSTHETGLLRFPPAHPAFFLPDEAAGKGGQAHPQHARNACHSSPRHGPLQLGTLHLSFGGGLSRAPGRDFGTRADAPALPSLCRPALYGSGLPVAVVQPCRVAAQVQLGTLHLSFGGGLSRAPGRDSGARAGAPALPPFGRPALHGSGLPVAVVQPCRVAAQARIARRA